MKDRYQGGHVKGGDGGMKGCWWRMKAVGRWMKGSESVAPPGARREGAEVGIVRWMEDWSLWVSVCAVCGRFPPIVWRDCGLTARTQTHTIAHSKLEL